MAPHTKVTYLKHGEVCLFIASSCGSHVKLVDDNVLHYAKRCDTPGRYLYWEYLEIREFMIRNTWSMVEDEERGITVCSDVHRTSPVI